MWKPYNYGSCWLTFFDREGNPFNGSLNQFLTLYEDVSGVVNTITKTVLLIDPDGTIVAKGSLNDDTSDVGYV